MRDHSSLDASFFASFDSALAHFASLCERAVPHLGDSAVEQVFWKIDRDFLGDGLPGRPYFRHLLQAPDMLNDYNSVVFPGVAYYADKDVAKAREQLDIIVAKINAISAKLSGALPPDSWTIVAVVSLLLLLAGIGAGFGVWYWRKKRSSKYTQPVLEEEDVDPDEPEQLQ